MSKLEALLYKTAVVITAFTLLVLAGSKLLERYNRVECMRWEEELTEYTHMRENVAGWQIAQCEKFGIRLPTSP